jgi:proliferating cell nuclear antigen
VFGLIELRKVDFWKRAVEAVSFFVPQGNFRFSEKGIFFKATDPSQIILVDYFVDKKLFDEYSIEPNFIGVDLVAFNRIMQRATSRDKMVLGISDSELKIRLESDLKRSFKLPLVDVSEDDVKVPDIKYDAKVEISGFNLKELLKDASLFGSAVVLKASNGKFVVEARSPQGAMESEAVGKAIKVSSKESVTVKFSLNFFQNIVKEADNEKPVIIELKNDAPMRVSFSIGESRIVFYLASMIL